MAGYRNYHLLDRANDAAVEAERLRDEQLKAERAAEVAAWPLQRVLDEIEKNKTVGRLQTPIPWEAMQKIIPALRDLGYWARSDYERRGAGWCLIVGWSDDYLKMIPWTSKIRRWAAKFTWKSVLPRLKEV